MLRCREQYVAPKENELRVAVTASAAYLERSSLRKHDWYPVHSLLLPLWCNVVSSSDQCLALFEWLLSLMFHLRAGEEVCLVLGAQSVSQLSVPRAFVRYAFSVSCGLQDRSRNHAKSMSDKWNVVCRMDDANTLIMPWRTRCTLPASSQV